jgi:peptide/nickel transport system permease protein
VGHLRFVGRRLLQAIPSLFAISVLSFLMLRLGPGDPARVIAGPRATPRSLAAIRAQLGLNQPVWVQYVRYLGRAFHGDFGENLTGSATVAQVIRSSVGVTAALVVGAAVMTVAMCVPLSVLAARRPDGLVDGLVRVASVGGLALPSFWVGLMLISYVALPTGLFPVGGWPAGTAARLQSIVLPSFTLAVSMAPILIRSLRSSLIEVQGADYVKAGRAMGVRGFALTRRFVARNAAVPTVPVIALVVGFLVGGTVIIESTFDLPGLGLALVQAAATRDANVVQGITLVLGSAVVVIYLVADVALSFIDPRVRLR